MSGCRTAVSAMLLMSAFDPLRSFVVNERLVEQAFRSRWSAPAAKRLLPAKSRHNGRHSTPFYQRTVLSRSDNSLYPSINGRPHLTFQIDGARVGLSAAMASA